MLMIYLSRSDDDIHDGDVREGEDGVNSGRHQGEHDGVTQAAVKTENKRLCKLSSVLIYFYLSKTLGIDHLENCEASIARGTRGMAMKMARLMLYRERAAMMAESWRQARHWTVAPPTLASLTGSAGSRSRRRVREPRARGTASSGCSPTLAPSEAARLGRL